MYFEICRAIVVAVDGDGVDSDVEFCCYALKKTISNEINSGSDGSAEETAAPICVTVTLCWKLLMVKCSDPVLRSMIAVPTLLNALDANSNLCFCINLCADALLLPLCLLVMVFAAV